MLRNVILIRHKRSYTAQLQDALAAVEHRQLVHRSQLLTELLVVEAVRSFPPS